MLYRLYAERGYGPLPPPASFLQNEYALMKLNGWELVASQIFFYSFQIFMVFIIMQFLVAIAVDAFAEVKVKTVVFSFSLDVFYALSSMYS